MTTMSKAENLKLSKILSMHSYLTNFLFLITLQAQIVREIDDPMASKYWFRVNFWRSADQSLDMTDIVSPRPELISQKI